MLCFIKKPSKWNGFADHLTGCYMKWTDRDLKLSFHLFWITQWRFSCLLQRKKFFFHVIILASLMLLSSGKFVEFFFDIHAVNVISADLMDLRQTFSVCICTFFTCKLPQFPQFVSGSYSSMPHSLILLGEKELKRVSLTLSAWNLAHM